MWRKFSFDFVNALWKQTTACATAFKLQAVDTFESLGHEKKSQVHKVGQPLPLSILHQAIKMASVSC